MRRWPVVAAVVALSTALVAQVFMVRAPSFGTTTGIPILHTQPDWYVARDAANGRTNADNLTWVETGNVPGAGTPYEPMVRTALLDLRRLSSPDGAMAAGAGAKWNYDWPRDAAFVAVALDRSGHRADALAILGWLGGQQSPDGTLAARYRLDGRGVPDGRAAQGDGPGWVLWALGQLYRPEPYAAEPLVRGRVIGDLSDAAPSVAVRRLADRSLARLLDTTGSGRRLPSPTPDYWEVREDQVSLGLGAPVLAGLQGAAGLYAELGDRDRARLAGQAAKRFARVVNARFGPSFQRYGDQGGRDAAVAMLMPPFVESVGVFGTGPGQSGRDVAVAWTEYQGGAIRRAGGLAPGTTWNNHGESWTPETALVAYSAAASGRTVVAHRWMRWLLDHRTPWGSLPEKVLPDGALAGPAPLAWTDALVVLTASELDHRP